MEEKSCCERFLHFIRFLFTKNVAEEKQQLIPITEELKEEPKEEPKEKPKEESKKERKIFKYEKADVTASGILFFKWKGKELYLLLSKYKDEHFEGLLEDLGGKAEMSDENIFSCAVRECKEESNNMIPENYYMRKAVPFYNRKGKYLCYTIELFGNELNDTSIFGTVETHTGFQRTISWYNCKSLHSSLLSVRIRNKFTLNNVRIM